MESDCLTASLSVNQRSWYKYWLPYMEFNMEITQTQFQHILLGINMTLKLCELLLSGTVWHPEG